MIMHSGHSQPSAISTGAPEALIFHDRLPPAPLGFRAGEAGRAPAFSKYSADSGTIHKLPPSEAASHARNLFTKTRKLTEEISHLFEYSIKEADRRMAAQFLKLNTAIKEKEFELKELYPEESRFKAEKLMEELEREIYAMPPLKQQKLLRLLQLRGEISEDELQQVDEELGIISPSVVNKIHETEALMAQAFQLEAELAELKARMNTENEAPAFTRIMYASVLLELHDSEAAKMHLSEAALRKPEVLDSPLFFEISRSLGIDTEALKNRVLILNCRHSSS